MTTFGGSSRLAPEKRSCLSATTTNSAWADQPATTTNNDATTSQRTYSEALRKSMQPSKEYQYTDYTPKQKARMKRTITLRRTPYNMQMEQVRDILQSTFCGKNDFMGTDIEETLEAITRDKKDRRRMYVTFRTYEAKRHVARQGFQLGDITIPGAPGDVSAYVRDVPYFMDIDDMRQILKPYGTILKDRMRTMTGTTISMGGYDFDMDLNDGERLPEQITYCNETIDIYDRNAPKHCTNCDRYGHLRSNCRQITRQVQRTTAADRIGGKPQVDVADEIFECMDTGVDADDRDGYVTERNDTDSDGDDTVGDRNDDSENDDRRDDGSVNDGVANAEANRVEDVELTEPKTRLTEEEAQVKKKKQKIRKKQGEKKRLLHEMDEEEMMERLQHKLKQRIEDYTNGEEYDILSQKPIPEKQWITQQFTAKKLPVIEIPFQSIFRDGPEEIRDDEKWRKRIEKIWSNCWAIAEITVKLGITIKIQYSKSKEEIQFLLASIPIDAKKKVEKHKLFLRIIDVMDDIVDEQERTMYQVIAPDSEEEDEDEDE